MRGRTHEHLGRSVYLVITYYYCITTLAGLGVVVGAGCSVPSFLSDQDLGWARMGARLGSAQLTHTFLTLTLTLTLALALALAWAFRLDR